MGVKKNILYSAILATSNYAIPLVTFPYISRVLGVENIGIISFVDSFVNYFTMFSMLGLNILGVREMARTLNDSEERTKIFSVLFSINLLFTLILLIAYGVIVCCVSHLYENWQLFFLGAIKLLFYLFLIEWFFKGLENFKYITTRTLILKFIYIVTLFIFVKDSDDVYIYYFITVLLVVFNAVINWLYSKKYVSYKWKYIKNLRCYIKPYVFLGLYLILTSMYTTFNVIYLGFVSTQREVGYYTTALKVYVVMLGLFTAFTNVMMPRMSALISEGNLVEFKRMINKSFIAVVSIGLPFVFSIIPLSSDVVNIIAGDGYEGAVLPMQIIMPLIVIVGFAQIMAIQVFIPLKKDNIVLKISFIGAVLGLFLTLFLVHKLNSVGTAITLLVSESSVTLLLLFYLHKDNILTISIPSLLKYIFFSVPYIFFCIFLKHIFHDSFLILLLSFVLCFIYFLFSQLFILKNQMVISSLKKIGSLIRFQHVGK